jgi:hypothetical protein
MQRIVGILSYFNLAIRAAYVTLPGLFGSCFLSSGYQSTGSNTARKYSVAILRQSFVDVVIR